MPSLNKALLSIGLNKEEVSSIGDQNHKDIHLNSMASMIQGILVVILEVLVEDRSYLFVT